MKIFNPRQKRINSIIAFLEATGIKEHAYAAKKAKWIISTLRVVKVNNKNSILTKLDNLLTDSYKEIINNQTAKDRLEEIVSLTDSINMMEAC